MPLTHERSVPRLEHPGATAPPEASGPTGTIKHADQHVLHGILSGTAGSLFQTACIVAGWICHKHVLQALHAPSSGGLGAPS